MDEMERERAQMVAEVEAQIERALASMAFSDGDGDNYSDYSRPTSALSHASGEGSGMGHSGIGIGHSSIAHGVGGLRHAESGPALRSASGRSAESGSLSMQSASESMDGSSRRIRSMVTATTLPDDASDEVTRVGSELSGLKEGSVFGEKGDVFGDKGVIGVMSDEDPTLVTPIGIATRRFSASKHEGVDGFGAVDHGISERSDVVALKVQQIQQKVGLRV